MTFWQDLRYALRMLRKSPGFAALTMLVLALGLGTNTAIFSLVDGVLLRPLPYRDPGRLAMLTRTDRDQTGGAFSEWLLHAVRGRATSLEQIAGFQYESFNLAGGGEPERLQGMVVTANLFAALGVDAQFGRTFREGEDQPGSPHVAVLSHGLWARKFGSDPKMIGQTLRLGGEEYRVIGVMPESFRFDRGEGLPEPGFDFSSRTELWTPLRWPATNRNNYLIAIARLRQGIGLRQAQAEMDIVSYRVETEMSQAPRGVTLSLARLEDLVVRDVRSSLLVLLCAVGLLLLIACANVANLLLLRAALRKAEFSIRASLGAGQWRLARQWMTECLVYAFSGGAIGLLLADAILSALLRAYPESLLRTETIGIHWPAAVFCFLLCVVTGIGLGFAPLGTTLRSSLNTTVKQGRGGCGREGRALRQWLIGTEVALSFVLLAGAGLLFRSFLNLLAIDPGFDPDRVLTTQIDLPPAEYTDGPKMIAFFRRVLSQLENQPQVDAAGAVTILPMGGLDRDGPGFTILGRSGDNKQIPPELTMPLVSAGYFRALGIPLKQGRYFTDADNENAAGAAILNEACARRWFPAGDAVGQRLSALGGRLVFTIVGVVGDVRHRGLEIEPPPMIYAPYAQVPRQIMAVLIRPMTLVVRGRSAAANLSSLMQAAVRAADPDQPLSNTRTMKEVLSRSLARRRLLLAIMSGFAASALLLALSGIYAVASYSVAQRTPEIGIHMALGATPAAVLRLVVAQGMTPTLAGVGAGSIAALASTRLMASLLYDVTPSDADTFACIAALLALFTAFASYVPARRAARVNPSVALRHE